MTSMTAKELLRWHIDAGVDETITDAPVDRFGLVAAKAVQALPQQPKQAVAGGLSDAAPALAPAPASLPDSLPKTSISSSVPGAGEGRANGDVTTAVHLAQGAETVEDLRRALESFEGCALKKTATNLVFIDGNPEARVMLIGEGPGAEEDRQGLPFVGPSGKLLDKMMASVGLDRTSVLISNTVFWRPPGNRTPTPQETAVCMPFVERLIELVDPKILIALGGPAAKLLLAQTAGVGRLRGKWFPYSTPGLSCPIEATALFHPAYLLRSPAQKRDTWKDWMAIKRKLEAL
ncbi:MAG: uracil-DNA glycosylase [Rhodospirillales bacterium]|nr:uracil-DNA glycosylase [Alphaproteobacteria bacterium]MBL6948092.1 uracil-DNA glycosylase [Rhodospirillales bacterium]